VRPKTIERVVGLLTSMRKPRSKSSPNGSCASKTALEHVLRGGDRAAAPVRREGQWAAGEAAHLDPARRVHARPHRPTREIAAVAVMPPSGSLGAEPLPESSV
jgi:hypothetical protein